MPLRFGRQGSEPGESVTGSFATVFAPDQAFDRSSGEWSESDTEAIFGTPSPRYSGWIARSAHASYDKGLLRVLLPGGRPDLTTFNRPDGWTAAWPGMGGLSVFAYDWLGRLHAIDAGGNWSRPGSVVRFSPGTGDIESPTRKPSTLDEYLLDLLPKNARDWLSADYFEDWLAAGGRPLNPTECAGYRIPLILGGEDDVPNLEIADLDVYLSFMGQIVTQTAHLPEGTVVDGVRFE